MSVPISSSDPVITEQDLEMDDDEKDGDGSDDFDDFQQWDDAPEQQDDSAVADDAFGDFGTGEDKKEEVVEVIQQKPSEPKPFDANSLLSGFMTSVGASLKKKNENQADDFASPQLLSISPTISSPDTIQKTNLATLDEAAQAKTQLLINQHFAVKEQIDVSSDEGLSGLLADSDKMQPLIDYLKVVNELDDETLFPVKAHYNLADEISKAEEQKKAAVMDEEFEEAAKLKKKILQLKEEAMTVERLRKEYIDRKPVMRM